MAFAMMNLKKLASFERSPRNLIFCVVCANFALIALYFYLGYGNHLRLGIGGVDSNFYYFYLRSLFFDGDLDFTNELAMISIGEQGPRTPDGRPGNLWSVGPAIFWSPFFLIAHVATLMTGGEADGFSQLYRSIIFVGNSLYTTIALSLTALFLRRFVRWQAALFAPLVILLCTPVTHYAWPLIAGSHGLSFFVAIVFLFAITRRGVGFLSGVALGLVFLVRWQDALYGLIALTFSLRDLRRAVSADSSEAPNSARTWIAGNILFLLGFLIGVIPQLLVWNALYGSPFVIPQGSGFMRWTDPQILPMLFSTHHGLFSWHPVLLAAVGGLWFLRKQDTLLVSSAVLVLLVQIYVNACVDDWFAAWSFGHRRFISLMPVFALGLGAAYDQVSSRRRLRQAALIATLVLAIWNQLFLYQYNFGLIAQGAKLTWREMITDKFRLNDIRNAHGATLFSAYSIVEKDDRGAAVGYIQEAYRKNRYQRYFDWPAGYLCATGPISEIDCDWVFDRWIHLRPTDLMAHWSRAAYALRTDAPNDETRRRRALELFAGFSVRYPEETVLIERFALHVANRTDPAANPVYRQIMFARLSLVYANLPVADEGLDRYYLAQIRAALE